MKKFTIYDLKLKIVSGFTQIELLLSMGILMILIGILTTVFGQILDVELQSSAVSSVNQNGRYIIARLAHDMRTADNIVLPAAPGDTSNSLKITINSVDYTYSLSNGDLILTTGSEANNLNSQAAQISALTFTRIGSGTSSDTVKVSFTVTSKTQETSGTEQKSFQTTLGIN